MNSDFSEISPLRSHDESPPIGTNQLSLPSKHVNKRVPLAQHTPKHPSNPMTRPKGVIFDLGGVLITSPLKAIQEYESEHHIPLGYLNYAMSSPSPCSCSPCSPLRSLS